MIWTKRIIAIIVAIGAIVGIGTSARMLQYTDEHTPIGQFTLMCLLLSASSVAVIVIIALFITGAMSDE